MAGRGVCFVLCFVFIKVFSHHSGNPKGFMISVPETRKTLNI